MKLIELKRKRIIKLYAGAVGDNYMSRGMPDKTSSVLSSHEIINNSFQRVKMGL